MNRRLQTADGGKKWTAGRRQQTVAVRCVLSAIFIALFLIASCSGCDKKQNLDVARATTNPADGGKTVEANESDVLPVIEMKTEIPPVRAVEVYSSGGKITRWYQGMARSDPNNELSFKIGGTISKINYREGNKILYERVFAKLDPTECKEKVERLTAQLRQAEVEAHKARSKLLNLQDLNEQNTENHADVEAAHEDAKNAQETVREKRKELQAALVELGHHVLRFTRRGVITSMKAKVGDRVEAGQTIAVFDLNMPLQITVEIPAVFLLQIGLSSIGRIKFEGKSGIYPVDVIKISEFTTEPDAKIPVTVKLRNPYSYLKPGTQTEVAFKFDMRERTKHYILPPGSVGEDDEGTFVYIVTPDQGDTGVVERRAVVAGKLGAQGQEVLEGLVDGEIIVVSPIHRLKSDIKVKYK